MEDGQDGSEVHADTLHTMTTRNVNSMDDVEDINVRMT